MIKKQRAHVNLRRNYKNKISLPIFLSELSKVGTDEILQFSIFLWIFIFPKEIQTHLIWHLTFKGSNPKVKEKEKKMDKKHHIISKAYLEWVKCSLSLRFGFCFGASNRGIRLGFITASLVRQRHQERHHAVTPTARMYRKYISWWANSYLQTLLSANAFAMSALDAMMSRAGNISSGGSASYCHVVATFC